MARNIGALLAGLLLSAVVVFCVEALDVRLFPLPPGIDPHDPEALRTVMAQMPVAAKLLLLAGWMLASLLGGWLAAKLARSARRSHAMVVGGFLLLGAIVNMISIPHPLWFWVAALLFLLPAAWLGGGLAGAARP